MFHNSNQLSRFWLFKLQSAWFVLLFAVSGVIISLSANAVGTWTALNSPPIPPGQNIAELLCDGTVLFMDSGTHCYRLTPDTHGSYVNGTWTTLASMHSSRWNFSQAVLTNGNVFVAGGEYGDANHYNAELYDSQANTWAIIPGSQSPNPQAPYVNYSDSVSTLLPNGNVMESDSQSHYFFYNVVSNIMVDGGPCSDMNEVSWCLLSNGCIFTVDNYGNKAEHYSPTLNQWILDTSSPPTGAGGGDNSSFLLPNGNVLIVGAPQVTAIYTPGASATSAGTLVNGPGLPMYNSTVLTGEESGGAVMVNGNVLLQLYPPGGGTTYYYEYNYLDNSFTLVTDHLGAFGGGYLLDLPDGSVLNAQMLYIYFPGGTPLPAGQPAINSITENADGSYHLTGTGLSGLTQGVTCNDDGQPCCNYPLVRLTNNLSGNVYYARTYGWTGGKVQTGSQILSTEFALPPNLPAGTYSLVVSAVGNASAPQAFVYSPPAAPIGLAATAGNAQAGLSWDAVSGATAYNIKRALNSGGPYYISQATVTATNYLDTNVVNGVSYYYVVTAVSSGGPSAYSSEVSAMPTGVPPVPTGLIAKANTSAMITVSWNSSIGATSYHLQRATNSGGPYFLVATPSGTNFSDITVAPGSQYYYVVSSIGSDGESLDSAPVGASTLPAPWVAADVGSVGATGNSTYSNGVFTVNGSGGDIWGSADALQYVYQAVSGNFDIRTRVTSLSNTSAGAKAGVMMRATLDAGSAEALMDVQPAGSGLQFIYRTVAGGSSSASSAAGNAPVWLRLTRTNNAVTAYYSANGTSWATLAAQTIIMPSTFYVGLAVCSHNAGTLCAGVFDNVSVAAGTASIPTTPTGVSAASVNSQANLNWNPSTGATFYNVKRATTSGGPYTLIAIASGTNYTDVGLPGGACYYVISALNSAGESANSAQVSASTLPPPWIAADVGSVGATGNSTYSNGVFMVNGSGGDIWGSSDAFQYVYQAVSSDCDIQARVVSLSNTSSGAKAGVMIRATLDSNSPETLMGVQPAGSGLQFIYRTVANGSSSVSSAAGNAPVWVRLTRTNSTITAYYGANGTTWTVLSAQTITMPSTFYVGLAVCSHNAGTLCNGVFDNVNVLGGGTVIPATPTGLTASAGNSQVSLGWNPSAGTMSYNVKRAASPIGPYALIATPVGSNYTDNAVTNGTVYYYAVSAANLLGESFNSSTVSVMPMAPVVLAVQSFMNGDFSLRFAGVDNQSYVVETSTNLVTWIPVWTNVQTGGLSIFTDTNVADKARFYRVQQ